MGLNTNTIVGDINLIPYCLVKIRKGKNYCTFNPLYNKYCVIDYTGYRVMEHCDGAHTIKEIVETVAKDFDMTEIEAMDYVTLFLDEMHRAGMVVWRSRVLEYERERSPPSQVYWDITAECNLRCVHCYNFNERIREKELPTEEIKRTLEEMSAFGVESVFFSGGEPLLRKDFLEIAAHAGSLGFSDMGMSTNGTLIDREVARALKAAKLHVQVSIDGDVAEIHDTIRGVKGAFDGAIRAIRLLKEEGIDPSVCTTAMKPNVDRIPHIIQLMKDLNVDDYRVQGIIPMGRGKTNEKKIMLTPGRMKSLVEYLESENIKTSGYNFTLKPPPEQPVDFSMSGACSAGSSMCSITAEGNVVPCTYFWGLNGENLRDHTFQWIWQNSTLLNYFRSIRLDDIKGPCRDCKWLLVCHGGCKAENYVSGDIFGSNRYCWIAEENAKG